MKPFKDKILFHNKNSKVKDPRNIKILDFSGRQGLIQKKRHKKHNPVQLGFLAKKSFTEKLRNFEKIFLCFSKILQNEFCERKGKARSEKQIKKRNFGGKNEIYWEQQGFFL